jgi:hypothetical protein
MSHGIETQEQQSVRRLAAIPKWAQQHIADTERKVAELQARVAALSQGPAESDTVVDGLGTYPDRELGLGVIIGFRLPDGVVIEARVHPDGYLEIREKGVGSSGTGALIVQPKSGNVLCIRSGEWW